MRTQIYIKNNAIAMNGVRQDGKFQFIIGTKSFELEIARIRILELGSVNFERKSMHNCIAATFALSLTLYTDYACVVKPLSSYTERRASNKDQSS